MIHDRWRSSSLGRLCALALLLTPALAAAAPQGSCTLAGDVAQISLSTGGSQNLTLNTPFGGTVWQMLGSASGDTPGHLAYGLTPMALNVDRYYMRTFSGDYRLLAQGVGSTDAAGGATDAVVVTPGANPALLGVTLHHAFLVLDIGTLLPSCVSNSVAVTFVP